MKQNEIARVLKTEIPVLWSHDWWHMRIRSDAYGYEQSCCARQRARRLSDRAEVLTNTKHSMAEWTYCLHDLKLHNPPQQQGEHKQNTNSFVTSILCTHTHITNALHKTELRGYSDIITPRKCFCLFRKLLIIKPLGDVSMNNLEGEVLNETGAHSHPTQHTIVTSVKWDNSSRCIYLIQWVFDDFTVLCGVIYLPVNYSAPW